ncbi:hypothetical protein EVAR_9089_1 [Eumeta japonica]|uniref:Uncharacterized protein n=1 Tax=Eumeta variegata TaxID=151549 RepID=A0A4C1TW58_EUMVA|nr:hypothetical protein EVAR_9089_1 [Eumeta japonica]
MINIEWSTCVALTLTVAPSSANFARTRWVNLRIAVPFSLDTAYNRLKSFIDGSKIVCELSRPLVRPSSGK